MKGQLKGLLLGLLIGGMAAFFATKEIYISQANAFLFSERAYLAKHIVKIMEHVEKKADIANLNGADCDIFVEYYSLINSYRGEINSGRFPIYGKDKSFAIDSINESLAILKHYRDRAEQQDCRNGEVPI